MKTNISKTNIRHDSVLHKISIEEVKKLILDIRVEHILEAKEYSSLLELKSECNPAEESGASRVDSNPGYTARTNPLSFKKNKEE